MTYTVTIQLSETTFEQLKRAAELSRKPVDEIVESSLAHSLPPLLEDIPTAYQPDVYPLLEMNDAELLQEALRRFPAERWTEYEALLDRKRQAGLAAQEQTRLKALRREADILTFRKGYAAVLLKRRGYRPPSLEELRPFPSLIRAAKTGQNTSPGTSRAHKSSD